MNITRQNYEEYFILYLDGELTAADRRQVEGFIQLHPDLKEELDQLLQYKFVPDTEVVFANKEELLRTAEDSPVTLSNYEEWFSLYIDNELTPGQRVAVEALVAQHPALATELSRWQQTRLEAEDIVFEQKESLYRHETKLRPLAWWRIAAAAVLLIAAGLGLYRFTGRPATEGGPDQSSTAVNGTPATPYSKVRPDVSTGNPGNVQPDPSTSLPATGTAMTKPADANTRIHPRDEQPVTVVKKEVAPVDQKKQSNDLPVLANNEPMDPAPGNNLPIRLTNPDVINTSTAAQFDNNSGTGSIKVTNLPAHPYNNQTLRDGDNAITNAVAYDEPEGKKGKLRGFFRKVTRTFEKRTNIDATDNGKLLVAGLAINVK